MINFCFPANVTPIHDGLSFTDDILIYDGTSYAVGMGHKEFRADKIMDQDYYLLTLAAIGKELDRRGMTKATIVIAAGLPLTWGIEQKESFRKYLMQNAPTGRHWMRRCRPLRYRKACRICGTTTSIVLILAGRR